MDSRESSGSMTQIDWVRSEELNNSHVFTQLIQELYTAKEQVDKLIRELLRTLPDFSSATQTHPLPDLATSLYFDTLFISDDATLKSKSLQNSKSLSKRHTRMHSWPAMGVASADALMTRAELIAFRILHTNVISLMDTNVAFELMKLLQSQMNFEKNVSDAHEEADDFLTKLLFIFAPLLRITESIVT